MADVSREHRVEAYLGQAARQRKARIIGNTLVAGSACVVVAVNVSVLAALLIFVLTPLAVLGLLRLLIRRDRARRLRDRPADVVAVARTGIRTNELGRFAPEAVVRSGTNALIAGSAEATGSALTWRPAGRVEKRGVQPITIPYNEIATWSATRMPGRIAKVDLLHFVLADGRDLLMSATDPDALEDVIETAGVGKINELGGSGSPATDA
jgi:hypothetical protein